MQHTKPKSSPLTQRSLSALVAESLRHRPRETHVVYKKGFLIRSCDPQKLHCLHLGPYSEHPLPKLNINRQLSSRDVPIGLFRRWDLKHGDNLLFKKLNLEITFLPEEAAAIASAIPQMLECVEMGWTVDWNKAFRIEFVRNNGGRFWTPGADARMRKNLTETTVVEPDDICVV